MRCMKCDLCRKPFHGEGHKRGRDMLCPECFQDIRQFRRQLRLILIVGLLASVALMAGFYALDKLWPRDPSVELPREPGLAKHRGD
jgi:hypothetical protein